MSNYNLFLVLWGISAFGVGLLLLIYSMNWFQEFINTSKSLRDMLNRHSWYGFFMGLCVATCVISLFGLDMTTPEPEITYAPAYSSHP